MGNKVWLIFLFTCFIYGHLLAQNELILKLNPGIAIMTNGIEGVSSHQKAGFIQDYRVEITYPIISHFKFVPSIGIQFYNFHDYFNAFQSPDLNIPARPLLLHYIVSSLLVRYHINKWSFDMGYCGHFMFGKNILLSKGINIGGQAFVYPYHFSDRYQNSIQLGLNMDWRKFRVGIQYNRIVDNIYDTKGFDVPGPREYRSLQSLQLNIGIVFK